MNRQPSRFEINVDDYIKFKNLTEDVDKEKEKEFKVYYGRVSGVDVKTGHIGVQVSDKVLDFPPGLNIYIEKKQVIQVYNSKTVQHLTPRLSIKHLWSDFIFREVKTTKCGNLLYAEYHYIGKNGFEKIKRFKTVEEAYSTIPLEFHKNIVTCYEDFFGFSKCKSLKNNDIYSDKEIFFSKKCFTELDWSDNPTGDFLINERGYNLQNPEPDSIICGIVENGEKGLFYRKWFLCSQEFMTLWTMVCDPSDSSLYETEIIGKTDKTDWARVAKHKVVEKKIKSFDKLLSSLNTSSYSPNLSLSLSDRKIKYHVRNLERAALYYNTRYKQVAEVLFSKGFLQGRLDVSSFDQDCKLSYTKFQKRLIRNLLWCKDDKF